VAGSDLVERGIALSSDAVSAKGLLLGGTQIRGGSFPFDTGKPAFVVFSFQGPRRDGTGHADRVADCSGFVVADTLLVGSGRFFFIGVFDGEPWQHHLRCPELGKISFPAKLRDIPMARIARG